MSNEKHNNSSRFRLGLIINPMAGLGGSVALKGSDGADTAAQALALGAKPKAGMRTAQALDQLVGMDLEVVTYPGPMGEQVARELGFDVTVLGNIDIDATRAEDTEQAAQDLAAHGVDIVLFAGGDGTARNIVNALPENYPVLGIPAGVKIHSGVYALSPGAAGAVVAMLVRGELVSLVDQEVRDIDEEAFRQGKVRAQYYGELRVPQEHRYVQNVKSSGREVEELVVADIAADVVEQMEDGVRYLMGSGSTVKAVMDELGLENTLLGVDVIEDGQLIASDCTASELLSLAQGHECRIIITVIGGQGHIIGRGNQQLSPEVLRCVGRENIQLIATKTKLNELEGRPLIVDSGDPQLDRQMAGVMPVITGYHDAVLYRVSDWTGE